MKREITYMDGEIHHTCYGRNTMHAQAKIPYADRYKYRTFTGKNNVHLKTDIS